jgi:hypothetical protein
MKNPQFSYPENAGLDSDFSDGTVFLLTPHWKEFAVECKYVLPITAALERVIIHPKRLGGK